MKPIRIAQVGVGHAHADATFIAMQRMPEWFEIIGVSETDPARMEQVRKAPYDKTPFYTVEELLEMQDLDAVAVESEEKLDTDVAQIFVERGIPVHMDKPGAPDLPSFRKLIQTAKEKNVPLQLGYMYRYNPLIADAVKRAQSGELGEIFSVEAQMSVHHPLWLRTWLQDYPGGMTYFLGCHLVDLILQIQGMPEKITAVNKSTGEDGLTTQDVCFAMFEYPRGVSFLKSSSMEYNGFDRRQLVICGTKGTIELRPLEIHHPGPTKMLAPVYTTGKVTLPADENNPFMNDHSLPCASPVVDRYMPMMEEFARMAAGEKVNPYTPDYELTLFETVMKCCGIEG